MATGFAMVGVGQPRIICRLVFAQNRGLAYCTDGQRKPVGGVMYHYNPKVALEELQEEAVLPHPVKLRDMILRNQLGPQEAQLLNHDFQEYLTRFGELQKIARNILEQLSAGQRK